VGSGNALDPPPTYPMTLGRKINLIVIHCTASRNGKPKSMDSIRREHQVRGFSDVGYHYVIQTNGTVMVGRSEDVIGAHAAVKGHAYNQNSIGICMVGGLLEDGSATGNSGRFSAAQWESLRIAVLDLLERYPGSRVVGHRDLSPDLDGDGQIEPHEWIKLCPTFDVSAWMAAGMVPNAAQVLMGGQW